MPRRSAFGASLFLGLLASCEPSASSPLEPGPPIDAGSSEPCAAARTPVVFASSRASFGFDRALYVMREDGSDVQRIAQQGTFSEAAWSPDGRTVAFRHEATTSSGDRRSEIGVMGADGSGMISLFVEHDSPVDFSGYVRPDGPSWSPDGDSLAYAAQEEGQWAVWLIARSGGQRRRAFPDLDASHADPSFAPVSPVRVAYVAEIDGAQDVWIADLDGGGARENATQGRVGLPRSPRWSADGNRLVFTAHAPSLASGEEVYVLDVDASELRQVTDDGAVAMDPCFSPDGQSVLFTSARSDPDAATPSQSIDLWRIDLDGAQPAQRITQGPGANFGADWYGGPACEP